MNTVEVSPYLWEIDNILSKEECSIIIDTAKPLLERNTVVEDSKIEGSRVADVRTSSGAHFNKDMKYSLEFEGKLNMQFPNLQNYLLKIRKDFKYFIMR